MAEWLRGECAADTLWLACELCDVLPANTRASIAWLPTCKSKKKGVNWAVKPPDWLAYLLRTGVDAEKFAPGHSLKGWRCAQASTTASIADDCDDDCE